MARARTNIRAPPHVSLSRDDDDNALPRRGSKAPQGRLALVWACISVCGFVWGLWGEDKVVSAGALLWVGAGLIYRVCALVMGKMNLLGGAWGRVGETAAASCCSRLESQARKLTFPALCLPHHAHPHTACLHPEHAYSAVFLIPIV